MLALPGSEHRFAGVKIDWPNCHHPNVNGFTSSGLLIGIMTPGRRARRRSGPAQSINCPSSGKSAIPVKLFFLIFRNIFLHGPPKSPYIPRHPVPLRGALASVTNAGRVAVDAAASGVQVVAGRASARERSSGTRTNGALPGEASWRRRVVAYGKTVWSWHPLLMPSWRRFSQARPGRQGR